MEGAVIAQTEPLAHTLTPEWPNKYCFAVRAHPPRAMCFALRDTSPTSLQPLMQHACANVTLSAGVAITDYTLGIHLTPLPLVGQQQVQLSLGAVLHFTLLASATAQPPSPAGPSAAPPTLGQRIQEINDRFHRNPGFAKWEANGKLADAGVLLHFFDGWENHERRWQASGDQVATPGDIAGLGVHPSNLLGISKVFNFPATGVVVPGDPKT
ncbi:MAG: hypothetical protein SGPRY_008236 [Prymnesium sp.]